MEQVFPEISEGERITGDGELGVVLLADTEQRARYDEIVDALTSWYPEVRASRIFGMPCLKRSGRVIAGFTRGAMVFKLTEPEAHARALAYPGAHLFDPSGRGEPFRQWVVVPAAHAQEWDALAYTAFTQDHSLRLDLEP